MARERRSVGTQNVSATYIVQIGAWDWSYSLGVNDPRYDSRSYSDHRQA